MSLINIDFTINDVLKRTEKKRNNIFRNEITAVKNCLININWVFYLRKERERKRGKEKF